MRARRKRVVAGLFFYPRGGSAQVVRSLCRALPAAGWEVTLAAGSFGGPGDRGHAATFFAGLDVRPVDYTPAERLADPLAAAVPFQPSYEDRPGSPDRVFARVDDAAYERLVAAWIEALGRAEAGSADVLHLHHLTPLHEAALRAFPRVPVVGELHGTELALLRAIDAGPPEAWSYAAAWRGRMRRWAQACARLVVSAPTAAAEAGSLLGVEQDRVVVVPNGIDPALFDRRPLHGAARLEHWRRWLVEDPRGWDESGAPGTVAYDDDDLDAFCAGGPVLLYSGRYTEVKRIPLLVAAHAAASRRLRRRTPLVLVGGYPGEYEGPHPLAVVRETGARDVFLAGWREHDELPDALNAADLLVLPSVADAFGLVLVEAMACGLPVVACSAHGPGTIVDDGETGWLVRPDDEADLTDALVEAADDDDERRRRGGLAYLRTHARYAWPAIAERVAAIYADVSGSSPP